MIHKSDNISFFDGSQEITGNGGNLPVSDDLAKKELLCIILKSIGEGVVATDLAGRIIVMNKAAEQFSEYSAATAVGRHLHEVIPGISIKSPAAYAYTLRDILGPKVEVIGQAAACFENHKTVIDEKGGERIIAFNGYPIHDDTEKVVGSVIIMSDITEKRKVEEERIRAGKLHSLGLLAGGIAHNFNNKLAVALGNINLARLNAPPGNAINEYLKLAERATSEIADLTQQLLTFSPGGRPMKRQVDIRDLLKRATANALRNTKWTCKIDLPDDLWMVEVDEGQINHAFSSLIASMVLSNTAGGTVEVAAENIAPSSQPPDNPASEPHLQITIIGHNAEISREHLNNLFDPYFFAHDWQNGMWLATSHSIINKHGGHIMAENRSGHIFFRITIPALTVKPVKEPPADDQIHAGKGRILLMDDEASLLDIFGEMLRRIGYTVTPAGNGNEAIALYDQALRDGKPFNVAILDMTIPGEMGGVETMRHLRGIDPKVKAVICSGYTNDPIMVNYGKHGFQGVLNKPFKLRELGTLLHRICNGSKAIDQP